MKEIAFTFAFVITLIITLAFLLGFIWEELFEEHDPMFIIFGGVITFCLAMLFTVGGLSIIGIIWSIIFAIILLVALVKFIKRKLQ